MNEYRELYLWMNEWYNNTYMNQLPKILPVSHLESYLWMNSYRFIAMNNYIELYLWMNCEWILIESYYEIPRIMPMNENLDLWLWINTYEWIPRIIYE